MSSTGIGSLTASPTVSSCSASNSSASFSISCSDLYGTFIVILRHPYLHRVTISIGQSALLVLHLLSLVHELGHLISTKALGCPKQGRQLVSVRMLFNDIG